MTASRVAPTAKPKISSAVAPGLHMRAGPVLSGSGPSGCADCSLEAFAAKSRTINGTAFFFSSSGAGGISTSPSTAAGSSGGAPSIGASSSCTRGLLAGCESDEAAMGSGGGARPGRATAVENGCGQASLGHACEVPEDAAPKGRR